MPGQQIARYQTEWGEGGERLRLPIRAKWWAPVVTGMLILIEMDRAWRAWRQGGFGTAFVGLDGIAALLLLGALGAQLFCTETIRVVAGDLVIRMGWGPIGRTWRYPGTAIQRLQSWGSDQEHRNPFKRPQEGAVSFLYGEERIFIAPGIDEIDGAAVAEWLGRRLPKSATSFEDDIFR